MTGLSLFLLGVVCGLGLGAVLSREDLDRY